MKGNAIRLSARPDVEAGQVDVSHLRIVGAPAGQLVIMLQVANELGIVSRSLCCTPGWSHRISMIHIHVCYNAILGTRSLRACHGGMTMLQWRGCVAHRVNVCKSEGSSWESCLSLQEVVDNVIRRARYLGC